MIVDLHNHTSTSHDGFTTQAELLSACIARGIDAIAVTEHDAFCELDADLFGKNGIELIFGREFTTNDGAHILGLFISNSMPKSDSRYDIIHHIKSQNGIVIMPHPYKSGSGYLSIHGEDELINEFDFIEIVNGGWRAEKYGCEIIKIAQDYNLKMIASSDSHRGCQVGLCATKVINVQEFCVGSTQRYLSIAEQGDLELLIDFQGFVRKGRRSKWFQITSIYQLLLTFVPKFIRRLVKKIQYKFSNDSKSINSHYKVFKIGVDSW